MLDVHRVSSAHHKFFSDTSGQGYAAVLGDRWIHGSFPPQWKDVNITTKELVPMYFAFSMWAPILSIKNIIFLVDNSAVVDVLKSQTSKDPTLMSLLRLMVVAAMLHNIQFYADHIRGKHNVVCDLISRFHVQKALQMDPWLEKQPHQVPLELLPW